MDTKIETSRVPSWLTPEVVDKAVTTAKIGSGSLALLSLILGMVIEWQHKGDTGIIGMVTPLILAGIFLGGVWLLIAFLLERFRRRVHRYWHDQQLPAGNHN